MYNYQLFSPILSFINSYLFYIYFDHFWSPKRGTARWTRTQDRAKFLQHVETSQVYASQTISEHVRPCMCMLLQVCYSVYLHPCMSVRVDSSVYVSPCKTCMLSLRKYPPHDGPKMFTDHPLRAHFGRLFDPVSFSDFLMYVIPCTLRRVYIHIHISNIHLHI